MYEIWNHVSNRSNCIILFFPYDLSIIQYHLGIANNNNGEAKNTCLQIEWNRFIINILIITICCVKFNGCLQGNEMILSVLIILVVIESGEFVNFLPFRILWIKRRKNWLIDWLIDVHISCLSQKSVGRNPSSSFLKQLIERELETSH